MSYHVHQGENSISLTKQQMLQARTLLAEHDMDITDERWRFAKVAADPDHWTLSWEGESNYGGDEDWMTFMAPAIPAGQYIVMHGEDGAQWRYYFDGTQCHNQVPIITWPAPARGATVDATV